MPNVIGDLSPIRSRRLPRIDQHGEVVYFIDVDARRWRVYDTSIDQRELFANRISVHRVGSPAATARVFVPPDPDAQRYSYTFRPGDARDATIEVFYRQLLAAAPFQRPLEGRRDPRQRPGLRRIAM